MTAATETRLRRLEQSARASTAKPVPIRRIIVEAGDEDDEEIDPHVRTGPVTTIKRVIVSPPVRGLAEHPDHNPESGRVINYVIVDPPARDLKWTGVDSRVVGQFATPQLGGGGGD